MRRSSLRAVLLGSVLGTITVAFTLFAVYLDRVEQSSRLADIDSELLRAEQAGGPAVPARPGGPRPGASDAPEEPEGESGTAGTTVDLVDPPVQLLVEPDGAIVDRQAGGADSPLDADTVAALVDTDGNRTIDDPRYRVRVTTQRDGRVAVTALALDEYDRAVGRFRTSLVLGGGVILALVALVLWVLTGYLARPVTRLATLANRIADGELDTAVGEPSGSRETAELTTDLDRMLDRLRAAIDEATSSRDAMERFLADMAHEIRTPLTALKGYSDLHAGGMLDGDGDVDRAMARIGSESERLAALANAMLQLAADGVGDDRREPVELGRLAGDVVADLGAAYPEQQIRLDVETATTDRVLGSRARLHQALLNLGSNACHHHPPGQPIVLAVRPVGSEMEVSVTDGGPGVDPADRDRIFLPFSRADSARHRDGQQGAGLGLALTRQIAEQHGGSVTVEEGPGGGARFLLRLPMS